MGKQIDVNLDQLEALCRLKPTLADCAAFFNCSEDTIERRVREQSNCTFAEFREQKMVETRFNLIRLALRKCEQSDVMHIFCLKNLCGWRDKQQDENERLNINVTLADQMAKARARIKQMKSGEME